MSRKTKAVMVVVWTVVVMSWLGLVAPGVWAADKKKAAGGGKMAAQSGPLAQLEQAGELIVAKYVKASLPLEASSPLWAQAPSTSIRLSPQVSTYPMMAPPAAMREIVRSAKVRALYNDREVAFRLEWADPEPSFLGERLQAFRDAAALGFPLSYGAGQKLPYVGMGEKGRPVNIWFWRAAKVQPGGLAKLPTPQSPVESLIAEGFGTLTSLGEGDVQGEGIWKQGAWKVVFKRSLRAEGDQRVQLDPSQAGLAPVAFAIWNGHFEHRDGRKGLSSWHFVRFEKGSSPEAYARQLVWNPPMKGDPQEGRRWAIEMLECDQCHNFPGARPEKLGDVGPDLTYIGAMHRPDYLLESLKDPNATVLPNDRYFDPARKSKMPLYDTDVVPEKGYYDLVEFLRTLK